MKCLVKKQSGTGSLQSILQNHTEEAKASYPLLYMRGIKKSDLVSIVDFIYLGEVNIAQEDLDRFLKVAKE